MAETGSSGPVLTNSTNTAPSHTMAHDHQSQTTRNEKAEVLESEEGPLPDVSGTTRDDEEAKLEGITKEKADGSAAPQAGPPGNPGAGFPDGGVQAWLCVFGAFWALFVSFGWINCIGVFQDYYQTELLSDYSPSTVAWIPSIETFFMFIAGPIHGYLYDQYGPRYVILVGSFLHVFGLMMTSISTQYYQILLAQSICSSIGASAVFFPAMSSVSTWFFHKRATAIGIVASGSSLGGVIFPILVQRLIPILGFGWTMRVCAFVILGLLIITNLTVSSRLPPAKNPFKFELLYRCFREPIFTLITAGGFIFFLAMFIPFDFIILQAESIGMDPYLASYLIPILNAASIIGRTLPGYLGDKLGRMNVLAIFCSLAGILTLALWLPSAGNAAVIVYAAFYGFASGAFISLVPATVAQISPIREIGVRNGSIFAVISVAALVGNPIAGSLISQDGGKYTHLQIFTGIVLLAGSCTIFTARFVAAGFKMVKI